jgi:hypothetical protein
MVGEDAALFQAVVAECSGSGAMGSLALCAAMLRAFARDDGFLRRLRQLRRP